MGVKVNCTRLRVGVGADSGFGQSRRVIEKKKKDYQKLKFRLFHQRHAFWTSFGTFVVTYRVVNFLPKLVNMPLLE